MKQVIHPISLFLSLLSVSFGDSAKFSDAEKFIFFAVLEGLYEDGVDDASLTRIIGEEISDNFVHGCPICVPTYHALITFKVRPEMKLYKYEVRDFGNGLSVEQRVALAGEPEDRRKQIRSLVSTWIERRFEMINFSKNREQVMRGEIAEFDEKGSRILDKLKMDQALGDAYSDWESCPICSGATLHAQDD